VSPHPFDFPALFAAEMADRQPSFSVVGMATDAGELYPIGTDTKVLSTAFELVVRPLVHAIAAQQGVAVAEPTAQTVYPDFTLLDGEADPAKIAVDVKTTYRRPHISFTLGSYTSFLRNNTKNIHFPHDSYARHLVVGFVYDRFVPEEVVHVHDVADVAGIPSPVANVEWFVQDKYRIAGARPGSGNTTNIGSIKDADIAAFTDGEGPFAARGEAVFVEYWRNYGKDLDGNASYTTLEGYDGWKAEGN
jgi:hypothetical protein